MALQHDRPQLMNSSPTHPKVKISMDFSDPLFVGGTHVCGQLAMECRADKGLGISGMMVELFGTEGANLRQARDRLLDRIRRRVAIAGPYSQGTFPLQSTIIPRTWPPAV